jgi:hypothetical protein
MKTWKRSFREKGRNDGNKRSPETLRRNKAETAVTKQVVRRFTVKAEKTSRLREE